jgi:hypothetical protein
LPLAAVYQHQAGQRRPAIGGAVVFSAGETPPHYLLQHGVVVSPIYCFYAKAAVVGRAGTAIFKYHHAADGHLALGIGNIIALNALRRRGQPQNFFKFLKRLVRACDCDNLLLRSCSRPRRALSATVSIVPARSPPAPTA